MIYKDKDITVISGGIASGKVFKGLSLAILKISKVHNKLIIIKASKNENVDTFIEIESALSFIRNENIKIEYFTLSNIPSNELDSSIVILLESEKVSNVSSSLKIGKLLSSNAKLIFIGNPNLTKSPNVMQTLINEKSENINYITMNKD